MPEPRSSQLRYRVEPRDVPPAKAARRLGLTLADFERCVMNLIARGFPRPDESTGHYDLKAVDAWMDQRSALTSPTGHGHDQSFLRRRLEAWDGGQAGRRR